MIIDFSMPNIDDLVTGFSPETITKATASTLNKTAAQTRTESSRLIREEYNVSASDLSKYLKVTAKATTAGLFAIISGKGEGIPLYKFDAKQARLKVVTIGKGSLKARVLVGKIGTRPGPVTVRVRLDAGLKEITSLNPKPFIAQMKTGHIGVFVRKGAARGPINERYGPDIKDLFARPHIQALAQKYARDQFRRIFTHELEWYAKQ